VRRMLGGWTDNTLFDRAVNQPVAPPALKQPMGIQSSGQMDTGPRSPQQETKHRLEPCGHLVIENLPAVRVAARRIYRLLPDHVSFAKIYLAGVSALVEALDEFHASSLVRFADFAKLEILDAILDSLPQLVWEAAEQRQKGKSIEAAIHGLRTELDRSLPKLRFSHERHMDLAAYRCLLGELDD
jgi:DNA-directed RNA polymerase specialized sigma subunit